MTDTMEREGVNIPTTTDTVRALTLSHDSEMNLHVRRFGFEYEMFPSGYYGDRHSDPSSIDDEIADHMDYWEFEPDEDECSCDDCYNAAYAEEERRFAAELRANLVPRPTGGGGIYDLVQRASRAELIADPERHHYHCHCSTCSPTRRSPLMCAQTDGSCGVEFVSRIIDLHDFDTARSEMSKWIEMMNGWKGDGNWMPDGVTPNGNHVHVSSNGDHSRPFDRFIRQRAYQHIDALYAAFDWNTVADGGCGRVRGYNGKPHKDQGPGSGSYLADRGYGTFEHRLWNTPRDPERLWGHTGLSIAITRWAFNIATQMPDFTFWNITRPGRYGGSNHAMSDDVFNDVTSNVKSVIGGIADYVPDFPEFEIATELITNLRPVGA